METTNKFSMTIDGFADRNEDIMIDGYDAIAKETAQETYKKMIGSEIEFLGEKRKVKDVRITEEWIYVDFEKLPEDKNDWLKANPNLERQLTGELKTLQDLSGCKYNVADSIHQRREAALDVLYKEETK